ncbi:protein amnionless-like [Sphaerodactylus townsendi]|uniref:protein amnionless-like n=1 Tax=Sphaerodactylus townsendi TaxID=933632 RepID=UPI0020274D8A|nr:protein amnionless-like [Sphaerodactylus townsendi]
MAISKVHRPDASLGLWPRSSASFIQIVLMDNRTGSQSGIPAEQLAEDIMNDIAKHGESFDIVGSSLQTATGNKWSTHGVSGHISSSTTGMIIGSFLILLLLGIVLLLYRKGILRSFPCVHLLSQWKRMNDLDSLGEAADKGFDNPMFDTPSSLACSTMAASSGGKHAFTEMFFSYLVTRWSHQFRWTDKKSQNASFVLWHKGPVSEKRQAPR